MPLLPVEEYDEARYPTLEEMTARRRDILRGLGLSAIAAAFGPHVVGCGRSRGTVGEASRTATASPTSGPVAGHGGPVGPMLAGAMPPPHWPGPRGAIVGGGPVRITYGDGVAGWVAVAVVFDPSNEVLESALAGAEARVASVVRERLARERSGFLGDPMRTKAVETALLQAIQALVPVQGLNAVAISAVDAEAAEPPRPRAPAAAPAAAAAAAAPAPAPLLEAAPPPPSQAPRTLPRAGAKCPIHPNGCRRSDSV
jgi:hypothetical protein